MMPMMTMRYGFVLCVFAVSISVLQSEDTKPLPKGPLSEARQRLNRGNYAEARAAYAKLRSDAKLGPASSIGIARSWILEGEYTKALDELTGALKSHSTNVDLLAARADLYYELGRWDEALQDVDTALKLQANHIPARWTKARITRDQGNTDSAYEQMRWFVRAYNEASNADQDIVDPDLLLIIGQAATENARWNSISNQFRFILREIYGDVLKYDPDCWQAELYAGQMLLEKYNRPQAVESFEGALKINPNAAEAVVGKAAAALQKYDLKEAELLVDEALKQNPRLRSALRLKADIFVMGGDYASAEKQLLAAKAINPREAATLGKLAGCYFLQRKTEEFNATVKTAESFDSKPAEFYFELAGYLEDRKYYTQAEMYFKKATEFRPKFAAPKTSLGLLYMRLGKEKEGKEILDSAFKADPFNVRVANMRKVIDHLSKYSVVQTEHYELKFDRSTDRVLAQFIAEYLEETHIELKRQFNYEPPGRVTIEVFNRHDMFSGRTVGLPDLHTIGACTGRVVAMASPSAQGLRKPFNWGRVIRHEMTHIFNLAQTDFQCPHWLTEGLAVQNEQMKRPLDWMATLRDRADENTLFNLDTIMMGFAKPKDQSEWGLAYCQSQLYVEYLIKTYGQASVGKILNAYRDGLDTAAAIQSVCGVEKSTFEKGYRIYVDEVLKPYRGQAKKPKKVEEKPMTFDELTEAQKANPDDPDLSARLAEQLLRRNKTNEARKLIDGVLLKKKGHALASLLKARLLLRAGDEEAARELLEGALKESPQDPRLLNLVAKFHLDAEQYEKAAELFEKGRSLAPLEGDWDEQLVRIYSVTKNRAKLMNILKDIVSRDPDELAGRIKLARAALEEKQYKEAEFYARDAILIDVNNEDARNALMDALTAQGKDDDLAKLKKKYE